MLEEICLQKQATLWYTAVYLNTVSWHSGSEILWFIFEPISATIFFAFWLRKKCTAKWLSILNQKSKTMSVELKGNLKEF